MAGGSRGGVRRTAMGTGRLTAARPAFSERDRGVLGAGVGVVDQPFEVSDASASARPGGHVQRVGDQVRPAR